MVASLYHAVRLSTTISRRPCRFMTLGNDWLCCMSCQWQKQNAWTRDAQCFFFLVNTGHMAMNLGRKQLRRISTTPLRAQVCASERTSSLVISCDFSSPGWQRGGKNQAAKQSLSSRHITACWGVVPLSVEFFPARGEGRFPQSLACSLQNHQKPFSAGPAKTCW